MHTTAKSVPIAIITFVWYTGLPAASVALNVTSSYSKIFSSAQQARCQQALASEGLVLHDLLLLARMCCMQLAET